MARARTLASTSWLHDNLQKLRVLDASWYLPSTGRSGKQEFVQRRIEGSDYFDVDGIKDYTSNLPHMFPPSIGFAAAMDKLDIDIEDDIVVYDGDENGVFSAARAWYMLKAFGHKGEVSLLDGGLAKWLKEGRPVEKGEKEAITLSAVDLPRAACESAQKEEGMQTTYPASLDSSSLRRKEDVLQQVRGEGLEDVVDARGEDRFEGLVDEGEGGKRGHMPGAVNVPFRRVTNKDGTMKGDESLLRLFEEAGVRLGSGRTHITSCGSGVTACIPALALHKLGEKVALYDGSWREWSGLDVPVE